MSKANILGLIVNGVISKNETENHFACADEYFTDENDTEAPWADYMTQLGTTIANQSQPKTDFSNIAPATTILRKSVNSNK